MVNLTRARQIENAGSCGLNRNACLRTAFDHKQAHTRRCDRNPNRRRTAERNAARSRGFNRRRYASFGATRQGNRPAGLRLDLHSPTRRARKRD